uniref:MKI67 FHA domain-interacting nucleolar phosphoprotein n=1 Tax=Ceratitis capitata TaxID=7213 RepID=W8BA05_CERCA
MPPVRKNKSGESSRAVAKQTVESNTVVSGQLDKKLKKQQQKQKDKRGVVFLKHLPHGFFEEQLKNYFEQFGAVTRLRLGRSRRTGGSKGYAFVEFEYPEVAEVAAETMDNYLMFKKVVKAAYIPPEKQLYNYFRTSVRKVKNKAGKDIYVSHKTAAIQRKVKQMNNWSDKNYQKRALKKLEKVKKLNEKYAHLGIDFEKVLIEPKRVGLEDDNVIAEKSKATTDLKKSNSVETKKTKKNLELQDLLGNTINEDSADEDYIANSENDDSSDEEESFESTDEETYGFSKDSDDEQNTPSIKKSKKGKPLKAQKVDRLEKLIKRKPKTGGIQKAKKTQKSTVSKKPAKNIVQVKAAKELLKTQTAKKGKSVGLKAKLAKNQKLKK